MPKTKSKASTGPKYPDAVATLIGRNGNAFAVIGEVRHALRKAGVSREEQDQFMNEATSGDYDHLLRTAMQWVTVE